MRWRGWLRHCTTSQKVAGSIPDFLRPHYGPWVDSDSNRNEYQEHFLGCKGGRCIELTTLPPSLPIVLNLLEHYGPVQACNWIAYCGKNT
jgi:hypothetical protein